MAILVDEELDCNQSELYWSKKQWGFFDPSVPYLYTHLSFTEAINLAESRGLEPYHVNRIMTFIPNKGSSSWQS